MAIQNVLVYLGATSPQDKSYEQAVRDLGEGIAKQGLTLVYGGSQAGTMTVLADAVMNNGGQAIGVSTKALGTQSVYPGLTQTIMTQDLAERKTTMFNLADAIIAMPGSFGTWDELFDAMERVKLDSKHDRPLKPIAVLNLNGYYDGILELLHRSIQTGFTLPRYEKLLFFANSVAELLDWLNN